MGIVKPLLGREQGHIVRRNELRSGGSDGYALGAGLEFVAFGGDGSTVDVDASCHASAGQVGEVPADGG